MFFPALAEHHRGQKDFAPYTIFVSKREANQISHILAHQTSLSCHVGASSTCVEAANKCGNSLSKKAVGEYTMCGRDGKLESYQHKQKDKLFATFCYSVYLCLLTSTCSLKEFGTVEYESQTAL